MSRWQVVLLVIGVCAIGLANVIRLRHEISAEIMRLGEFFERLHRYVQNKGQDSESFAWLVSHSSRMQNDMGHFGIMSHFKPPFKNILIPNWPIILNGLSDMRQWASEALSRYDGPPQQFFDYAGVVQEALLRYMGSLRDRETICSQALRNPVIWFRYGIQFVLLVPLTLLRWLGFVGIPDVQRARPFRVVGGIISTAAFISSMVTIATGWDNAMKFAKAVMHKLH